MKNLTLLSATVLTATSGLVFGTVQAASALTWNWNYSGAGIQANGTFITDNTPNSLGFYSISGIGVPEPNNTLTLLVLGTLGIALTLKRKRKLALAT